MNIKTQHPSPQSAEAALAKLGVTTPQAVEGQEGARSGRVGRGRAGKDSYNVSLSPESQGLKEARAKAYEIAMTTPDVREDRVRELKDKIKNGSYQMDPGGIADGMLREAVRDRLAEGGDT